VREQGAALENLNALGREGNLDTMRRAMIHPDVDPVGRRTRVVVA
jgi:hypothetical protein